QQQQPADRPVAADQLPVQAQAPAPLGFELPVRIVHGPPAYQAGAAVRAAPHNLREWRLAVGKTLGTAPAPVAQPDRVVASEAIGRGFESLRARQSPNGSIQSRPTTARLAGAELVPPAITRLAGPGDAQSCTIPDQSAPGSARTR